MSPVANHKAEVFAGHNGFIEVGGDKARLYGLALLPHGIQRGVDVVLAQFVGHARWHPVEVVDTKAQVGI